MWVLGGPGGAIGVVEAPGMETEARAAAITPLQQPEPFCFRAFSHSTDETIPDGYVFVYVG